MYFWIFKDSKKNENSFASWYLENKKIIGENYSIAPTKGYFKCDYVILYQQLKEGVNLPRYYQMGFLKNLMLYVQKAVFVPIPQGIV